MTGTLGERASGPWRAWIDESGSDQRRDPGTYILAAAIGRCDDEARTREKISGLRLAGQAKLHWRSENNRRRAAITRAVAACDLDHLVVIRSGPTGDRPERRRRKCLERLLYELDAEGIADVVLESRGRVDDRRDVQMLNALRGQRYLSTAVRLTHTIGRLEPMLWLPDAICGAVTSSRTGADVYREMLQHRLTVVEI